MASLKNLLDLVPKAQTIDVKAEVYNALIVSGEPAVRNKCLAELSGKGLDKELASVIFDNVVSEEFTLLTSDLHHIREYIGLLGSDSAVALFKQYVTSLAEGVEKKYSRNLVLMICYFVNSVNVLGFDKLRAVMKELMTPLVEQLWKAGKCGESCYLARHLFYLVSAENAYINNTTTENEKLFETMLSESETLRKSPLLCILSVLLGGTSTSEAISPASLDQLTSDEDTEFCVKRQLSDLLLAHKATLLCKLPRELCLVLIKFVMKEYTIRNEVSKLVELFTSDRDLLSNQSVVWQLVIASIISLIQEELELSKSSKDAAAWIGSLVSLFEKDKDDVTKPLNRILDKFVAHRSALSGKATKVSCGPHSVRLAESFHQLPVEQMPTETQNLCKVVFVVLATLFHSTASVFKDCVLLLARLLRISPKLNFHKQDEEWMNIYYGQWLKSAVKMDGIVAIRDDLVDVLKNAQASLKTGFDSELKYLRSEQQESGGACSEEKLIRLSALFAASPWSHISKLSAERKEQLIAEIKLNALDQILADMDFASSEKPESVERWSYVFCIFDSMARADRDAFMGDLLNKKQRKQLAKCAVRLVDGTLTLPEEHRRVILSRAVHFLINIVPAFELNSDLSASRVYSWDGLVNLQTIDIGLITTLMERTSAEKVSQLLSEFPSASYGVSPSIVASMLAVAAEAVGPRLAPHLSVLLVPFASMLSAGDSMACDTVLLLAANIIKTCSTTDHEKQLTNLCLSVAGCYKIEDTALNAMFYMDTLLYNALRYTYSSVNNEQCAFFVRLITKHFDCVQRAVQSKTAVGKDRDRLVFGCARIANQLSQHSTHYARIVASLISETIMGYGDIELAMLKLQSINDRYSSAMLATTMPPVQRRQYSRVFPVLKRAGEKLV